MRLPQTLSASVYLSPEFRLSSLEIGGTQAGQGQRAEVYARRPHTLKTACKHIEHISEVKLRRNYDGDILLRRMNYTEEKGRCAS